MARPTQRGAGHASPNPNTMKYLSVCSGIEAATVAWEPLGWQPVAFSEIEPFPSAVLAHHWPDTLNLGDMTKHHEWTDRIQIPNLVVGGCPCQAFSIAGLRQGLDDPRGNLTLTYLAIIKQFNPRWVAYENVPGILSDRSGAFRALTRGLEKLGYGWAYRTFDAQYFGVPQRRKRVFLVGYLGDWRRAAAVLFEPQSMRGDSPPSREKREEPTYEIAPCIAASGRGFSRTGDSRGQDCLIPAVAGSLGRRGTRSHTELDGHGAYIPTASRMVAFGEYCDDDTASTLKRRDYKDATDLVTHTLRGEGFDASKDGTGRGTPLVPVAFDCKGTQFQFTEDNVHLTLRSMNNNAGNQNGGGHAAVAFETRCARNGRGMPSDVVPALKAESGSTGKGDAAPCIAGHGYAVRRLTPTECARLQGFPDDHYRIPWRGKPAELCPDGPQYKAYGNSMAVPCMEWIGERIQLIENLTK